MSTEEHRDSNPSSGDGEDNSSLLRDNATNTEQAQEHTTNATAQKQPPLYYAKRFWNRYSSHQWGHFLKDPKTWFETLALAVVIVYTVYAGKQSKTMSDTLAEIRKQTGFASTSATAATNAATAADGALKATRENFIKDQRPWVFINTVLPEPGTTRDAQGRFAVGARLYWRIYFSNYGRSPAFRLRGAYRIFHGQNAMRDADTFFASLPKSCPDSDGGKMMPPGGPPAATALVPNGPLIEVGQQFTTVFTDPLTADDVTFIYTHDLAVVVVGRTQYRDLSDSLYAVDFCYSTFVTGAINDCGGRHNEAH